MRIIFALLLTVAVSILVAQGLTGPTIRWIGGTDKVVWFVVAWQWASLTWKIAWPGFLKLGSGE